MSRSEDQTTQNDDLESRVVEALKSLPLESIEDIVDEIEDNLPKQH